MGVETTTFWSPDMRDKQERIIAEFAKVSPDGPTLAEAFKALDAFTACEESFDHQTACYDEVWENPYVTEHNNGLNGAARDMGSVFFTLYALKSEYAPNTYRPVFKFVFGRIGNTRVWDIN